MIRVVLDTNVVVSALFSSAGFEDRALKPALHGIVQLYTSPPVLAEYEAVLSSPKFDFGKTRIRSTLQRIQNAAQTVRPMRTLNECLHEEDNRFLECGDTAGADYLITGNKRHFPERWKQTGILNARVFRINPLAPNDQPGRHPTNPRQCGKTIHVPNHQCHLWT